MNNIKGIIVVAFFVIVVVSCSKDKILPSVAETNGAILAGSKGSSKTWKISSVSGTVNAGNEQTLSIGSCFLDNIYVFSNNVSQDYKNTEGSVKCNSTDSTLVEKGSWAFTSDGKSLLIDGAPYSNQNLFTTLGLPVSVEKLTDASMRLSFATDSGGNHIIIYLNFVKV
jgi:hypothetical protein